MLVSLADIKTYLGITSSSHDAFLTTQEEIVSSAVEGYCNRVFSQNVYTQTYYYEDILKESDLRSLTLFHYPVNSVTAIKEIVSSQDPSETTIVDYRFHSPTGIVTKNQGDYFFRNGKILEVEYDAGYATLPALVKYTILDIIQERYNKHINGVDLNFGSDVQRVSIPGAISIDFDYSLENNQRKSAFGLIIGNHANVLDSFRSERSVVGSIRLSYVTE